MLDDFKSHGGEAALLDTGKDNVAHELYVKHGFADYNHHPQLMSTCMRVVLTGESQEKFDERYFAATENVEMETLNRSDKGLFMQFFNAPLEWMLKNYALNLLGVLSVDGQFLDLINQMEGRKVVGVGLMTNKSELVGMGMVLRLGSIYDKHRRCPDVFVHPNFVGFTTDLVNETMEEAERAPKPQ